MADTKVFIPDLTVVDDTDEIFDVDAHFAKEENAVNRINLVGNETPTWKDLMLKKVDGLPSIGSVSQHSISLSRSNSATPRLRALGSTEKRKALDPSSKVDLYISRKELAYTDQSKRFLSSRNREIDNQLKESDDLPNKLETSNKVLRWNLLWTFLILLALYPLWLTFISCRLAYEITIILQLVACVTFFFTGLECIRYTSRMSNSFKEDWTARSRKAGLEPDKVTHIMIMPCYKEPLELLIGTLTSCVNQVNVENVYIFVAMEMKTPDKELKAKQIKDHFKDSTFKFFFTFHTLQPGEIAGACSNRNFAARQATRYLLKNNILNKDNYPFAVFTTLDSDTYFDPSFLENLTYRFLKEPDESRHQVAFQSPLFYNLGLNERRFFTRVTSILRSYFMVGFLVNMNMHTMSVYSLSLQLLNNAGFFNPAYQMDDMTLILASMKFIGKRVGIRLVDIPTLNGPPSGDSFLNELDEFYIQACRWTIGAAEVFHCFVYRFFFKHKIEFFSGMKYFFWLTYYYGFVLCAGGMIAICTLIIGFVSISMESINITTCQPFGIVDVNFLNLIFPAMMIYQYLSVFLIAFIMDLTVVKCFKISETERVHPLRNIIHFIISPLVLWFYNCIEYIAIMKFSFYGKKVANHIPTAKDQLVGADNNNKNANTEESQVPGGSQV